MMMIGEMIDNTKKRFLRVLEMGWLGGGGGGGVARD